jgi:pimeloyl-ACP methyl ester carboxylesterase
MKRICKLALCLTAGTAVVSEINRAVREQKLTHRKCKTFEWKFGKINYIKYGQGPPLVLIHDLSSFGGAAGFAREIKKLGEKYEVYALDLLGYGYSDKPNITYSGYLYVSLIRDFLIRVVGEEAYVIAAGASGGFPRAAQELENRLKKTRGETPCVLIKKIGYLNPKRLKYPTRIFKLPVYGEAIYYLINSKLAYSIKKDAAIVNKLYAASHYKKGARAAAAYYGGEIIPALAPQIFHF